MAQTLYVRFTVQLSAAAASLLFGGARRGFWN